MKDITKTKYWEEIKWAINYNPTKEHFYIHIVYLKTLYNITNGAIYLPFYLDGEQVWKRNKPLIPNNTWERK